MGFLKDGNEHHESVAYASHLSILLVHARSVKEPGNTFIVIIID
jgi:hypothetical protein